MCHDRGITVLLSTPITAVHRDSSRILALEAEGHVMQAGAVIDCTGTGQVLSMIGRDAMLLTEYEPPTLAGYSLRIEGLSDDAEMLPLIVPYELARAVEKGLLPPAVRFTQFYGGPGPNAGVCKLAVAPDHWTSAELGNFVTVVAGYLIENVPGFAGARVIESSPRVLPRVGNRLRGRATVSDDDVLSARQLGPTAVHAWWPMEHWDVSTGPEYAYPLPNRHYDIPLDALVSRHVDNLFAAGACLSASVGATRSLRAAGICLATGDAAGHLAALAARA